MKSEAATPLAPSRVLADEIARRIQTKILDGTLRPGDRLPPERDLAEQLRVNRSSLREALKKLEQLRLVVIQQGSGIRVRSPDEASFDLVGATLFTDGQPNPPRIRDLLELREMLVPGILRLAMARGSQAQMEQAVGILQRSAETELTPENFARTLRQFEACLAHMSGNWILLLLSNSLGRLLNQPGFSFTASEAARSRRALLLPLRRLTVALRARDVEGAERALVELLRCVSGGILSGFEPAASSTAAGESPQRLTRPECAG